MIHIMLHSFILHLTLFHLCVMNNVEYYIALQDLLVKFFKLHLDVCIARGHFPSFKEVVSAEFEFRELQMCLTKIATLNS